jgi:YVTN family beta-propeller protein
MVNRRAYRPHLLPRLWLGLSLLLLAMHCKDKPPVEPDPIPYADGVLVVNEGNFQWGNASLDFIDAAGKVHRDVFKTTTGRPLGDVAQSIQILGSVAYLVVNNSGKVEALSLPSLESVCAVSGLTSPRHLLSLGGGRAYLSDLYSRQIAVLDLPSCAVVGSIATGGWTEGMVAVGSKVYVAQSGTNRLLVIDSFTDDLVDSIAIGREPVALVHAADGLLYVLSSGSLGPEYASLDVVDPASNQLLRQLIFPSGTDFPSDLVANPAGDTLYWLNGGIFRMAIGANSLPTQAWIPADGRNFYSLGVRGDGSLYVGDAKDYLQAGQVLRYHPAGALLGTYPVGIIPGDFGFLDD